MKLRYRKGSKNKTWMKQVTDLDRIALKLRQISGRVRRIIGRRGKTKERMTYAIPTDRYQMAKDPRKYFHLGRFLIMHEADRAIKDVSCRLL